MKKVPIWKGNDIGHGVKGGVLSVGSHDIKIGEEVPISLLSKAAIKSLRDKGAIVDEDSDDIESSSEDDKDAVNEEVKLAKTILNRAKKAVTVSNKDLKSANEAVDEQQVVYDKTPDEPESAKVKAEEALQALESDLETAQATSVADKSAVDQAKQALADIEG